MVPIVMLCNEEQAKVNKQNKKERRITFIFWKWIKNLLVDDFKNFRIECSQAYIHLSPTTSYIFLSRDTYTKDVFHSHLENQTKIIFHRISIISILAFHKGIECFSSFRKSLPPLKAPLSIWESFSLCEWTFVCAILSTQENWHF